MDAGSYLQQLDHLIDRGRTLRGAAGAEGWAAANARRVWLQQCGEVITALSGGSKAHWLARAFSEAFLVRGAAEGPVADVDAGEIVGRLIAVLECGRAALAQAGGLMAVPADDTRPRRFDFVQRAEIRPVLERAYSESRDALEQGRSALALVMACSVLDAIVTDALERRGADALAAHGAPPGPIADWPFAERIAVAERARVIHRACGRLPEAAWRYRDLAEAGAATQVSAREARTTAQVLNVILRDLDPGR
jgi:hypothetical protein